MRGDEGGYNHEHSLQTPQHRRNHDINSGDGYDLDEAASRLGRKGSRHKQRLEVETDSVALLQSKPSFHRAQDDYVAMLARLNRVIQEGDTRLHEPSQSDVHNRNQTTVSQRDREEFEMRASQPDNYGGMSQFEPPPASQLFSPNHRDALPAPVLPPNLSSVLTASDDPVHQVIRQQSL
jgi:hypothetical protein